MNSQQIARDLERTLRRYRAGLIDMAQTRQEMYLLVAMLKAQEQAEIEAKLDRIEAVLVERSSLR